MSFQETRKLRPIGLFSLLYGNVNAVPMHTHVLFSMEPMWHRHLNGHAACGLGVLVCHITDDCDVINPVDL